MTNTHKFESLHFLYEIPAVIRSTVKVHESELPTSSVAIHVTVFKACVKLNGELGVQVTDGNRAKSSLTMGSAHETGLVTAVKSDGQEIVGGDTSVNK